MTLAESLDASESTQAGEMGEADRHHVRLDLLRVLARLTPAQQRLCVMLGQEGLSIKEAVEQFRIPRARSTRRSNGSARSLRVMGLVTI